MVRFQPLPRQQKTEPPIAKPPPRCRQLTQPLPQVSIVRTARLIPRDPPGNSDQMTRPALAQPVTVPGMGDRITLRTGCHHFFEEMSFKTAMSSIASAKSFFSLPFSSSSVRSRLASVTSRPPNLAFHLQKVASLIT